MITVPCEGVPYSLPENEPVLDGLLDKWVVIPWSCRSGSCQSCLVQTSDRQPAPDPSWSAGLKDSARVQGYLLACQCKPTTDISLRLPTLDESALPAVILDKKLLNERVMAVLIQPQGEFTVRPGQYVTLLTESDLSRSYSVANNANEDGFIELHIQRMPDGRMSNWLHDVAKIGDHLSLRGPAGSCFYLGDDDTTFDILLAGTGTGLAPLYGIVQDALQKDHRGQIHLVHGAVRPQDLYLTDQLRLLAADNENFTYTACVLKEDGNACEDIVIGSLDSVALTSMASPKTTRAYFCGAPEIVATLKKKAFLAGVASKHIYSDAFVPTRHQDLKNSSSVNE